MLSKDQIEVPQIWHMALMLHDKSVDVLLTSTVDENAAIYHRLPLNIAATADPLGRQSAYTTAFEDFIYENPLLLSDFGKATVLLATPAYTMVPQGVSEDLAEDIAYVAWPRHGQSSLLLPVAGTDDAMLVSVDTSLLAFIRRTFPDATISHPMRAFVEYCAANGQGMHPNKIYAYMMRDQMYVAAFDAGVLSCATVYPIGSPDDAVYYIMANANATAKKDSDANEMRVDASKYDFLLAGTDYREEVEALLRNFTDYVLALDMPPTPRRLSQQPPMGLVVSC